MIIALRCTYQILEMVIRLGSEIPGLTYAFARARSKRQAI